jgi:hypothetical protein
MKSDLFPISNKDETDPKPHQAVFFGFLSAGAMLDRFPSSIFAVHKKEVKADKNNQKDVLKRSSKVLVDTQRHFPFDTSYTSVLGNK